MVLESIRAHCLSHPGGTEQIQWGNDLVFKVGGKMFCVACTEPVTPPKVAMSFKCDDETFGELVERDGVIPAPYLARGKVGGARNVRCDRGQRVASPHHARVRDRQCQAA